tara:strand:- start:155 stop:1045 length:891 start_codon:yes stop_codon:yes gene_type:complete
VNALNRVDLKQLRTLQCLLREGNLSRVADQLGVTQQAVSDQLKKLRATFNDRLFIRSGKGVTPTAYARTLGPKLDLILNAVGELLEQDEFNPATTTRTITISSTDLEQKTILPFLMQRLRREAPGLRLAVKKLELDEMANDLLDGTVDLVLTNPKFAPPSYPSLTLYSERYVCVAGKANEAVRSTMSVAEIADMPQVVVSPSRGDFTGAVHRWFEDQGHPRQAMLSVPTFTAAKATISETDLVGFIPSRLLPDDSLRPIELNAEIPGFDVIAVWHQRSSQDPLNIWIRDLLVQVSR